MAEQSGGQVGDDPALAAKGLGIQPLQKDLRRIADKCGNNGEKLLTLVGLQLTEIQGFLRDASTSSDAFFQGLVYWLGGNADDSDPVNWSTLLTAMKDAGMARDAGEWKQKIIERCAASLDRPSYRDAEQSGNDKTPTPGQEEPSSNVPQSAATSKAFPSGPEQTKTLCDNPLIQSLKIHVMNRYKILKPSESRVRVEYVQLALLEAQPYRHNKDEEDMMKLRKGGGKKLDFLESFRSCGLKSGKVREFVNIADLLKPTIDPANRMKVVYGQAGIGKTTMLTHICRSLTLDKPMKSSYTLVLYFPLRDKVVSSAQTLSGLLSYYATADLDLDLSALRRALVNSGAKEVLFIFDGADEVQDLLSSEERGVFQDLLEGHTLPQVDVIVSSRPGGLSHLMKQNLPAVYEIHGFPKLSIIKAYINDFFKSSPEKGERLWKELQSRDDLLGAAHIPMNLLIICHIFGKGGLPPTLTDCYKQFIVEVHNRESLKEKWKCFDRCPKDVKQLLLSLSRVAYSGLMSTPSTFVFEEEDVEKAFKTTSLDKSTFKGLLHEHPSISEVYSNNSTFNFSHTTQQELFSAYYISHLPVEEQIEFLRGNCSNPKFSMVLRFYAGLTRLADEQVVHTLLQELVLFNQRPFLLKASTTDHSICALDYLICSNDDPGLLHLFHFLYESQNAILTQSVARHLDGKSITFSLFLTSYDTRVIANCLRESHSFSNLTFDQRTATDSEHVLSCVSSILMSDSVAGIQELTLEVNRLTQTGGSLLKEGLARTSVEKMVLRVDYADMSAIAAVLEATRRKSLQLSVSGEGYGASDSDLEVAQSAARNTRIKELKVSSDSSFLLPVVKGLAANACVETLHLSNIDAGDNDDDGVGQALTAACTTNTTLKDVNLNGVFPFPLMEVLCSRKVPLERLSIGWYRYSSDSDLEVAQSSARNTRSKELEVNSRSPFLLSVLKGLAANTFVEKLVLKGSMNGDVVGRALATACTTNTTLKDIKLNDVFPFPLMEVLSSHEVPLERLSINWNEYCSDSDLEVALSSARNTRIKKLEVYTILLPSFLLPMLKGLAGNTCVEKLVLSSMHHGDDGGVGQALATTCTTSTTLKDIELKGVSPFPLMKVMCSREVPLERLSIIWHNLSEDPCTPETLETLAQNMKVKRFTGRALKWSTEYLKALADGLSRNKFLKEVDLGLRSDAPSDVKHYISAKLKRVKIHFL